MRSRTNKATTNRDATRAMSRNAGRASGVAKNRRGSALVLVVGTLALIAVIAAFYVTLGQADARVSRGVERGAEVDDIERQVAQYIAGIVAADRLAVYPETITNNQALIGARIVTQNGSTSTLQPTEADRQRFIREATDYPYTDYTNISIITDDGFLRLDTTLYRNLPGVYGTAIRDVVDKIRFRPEGDAPYMMDLPGALDTGLSIGAGQADGLADRRTGSDPWLAPIEPTFLGRLEYGTNGGLTHDDRVYSLDAGRNSPNAVRRDESVRSVLSGAVEPREAYPELYYLDNRDWAQISNLAPDGLSVNLWNFRNNFDAESGLGADANGRPRMSENRTLLTINNGVNGALENLAIRATDRLHLDPNGLEGTPSILGNGSGITAYTDANALPIKNTPAWWTMNQRFLYFPDDPSFQTLGRDVDPNGVPMNGAFATIQTPRTPDFADYQYADADGDGMYDSRWFELKDATLGVDAVVDLLSNETDMRFFIAGRVIDLSAMLNVNAATDGLVVPTSIVPAGATPAELDLRRQLTMQDAAERYAPVFPNPNANAPGAAGSDNITPLNQRLSYSNIQRLPFSETPMGGAMGLAAGDYEWYQTGRTNLLLPNNIVPLGGYGLKVGRFAYDAIRREIQGDELGLPSQVTDRRATVLGTGAVPVPLYESTPFEFYTFDAAQAANERPLRIGPDQLTLTIQQGDADAAIDLARGAANRRDYYYNVGGANIANPADAPITAAGFGGNLFGLEDLAELLTFHGANDDRVLSRLERTTLGRFDVENDFTLRFDPLRSNRPTALEIGNHDNRTNNVPPQAGNAGLVPDNLIDHETMALLALNPRLRLTTISGSAPIRSTVVEDTNRDGILSAAERGLTANDARLDLTANPSPQDLFNLYADALIPYSFIDATWANNPEGLGAILAPSGAYDIFAYNQYRTLSYGYRGSELGLRLSAHLAVNMADLLDSDDTPSAATVLAATGTGGNDSVRTAIDNANTNPLTSPYTWWSAGNQFDLGNDRLAPNEAELNDPLGTIDEGRKAYTVFGIEAQPFLTEVAVVSVYSDVPRVKLAGLPGGFSDDPRLTGGSPSQFVEDEAVSASYNGTYQGDPENRSADYIANGGQIFGNDCGGNPFDPNSGNNGWDDGPIDDVTLRFDTSGTNPDLLLHVLAIQITNPFDVPINLTDDEPAYVDNPLIGPGATWVPGTPARLREPTVPNQSFVGQLNGQPIDNAKFYIEYNGHFFPLVEYIEDIQARQEINPFVFQESQPGLYRIVLEPGESRVVYVSAHPSLRNMTQRWKQIEQAYRGSVNTPGVTEVGGQNLTDIPPDHIANPNTTAYVQNYIDDQFAVRADSTSVDPNSGHDIVYPSRIVPFRPDSGQMLPQGNPGDAYVEFMRPNLTYRQPDGVVDPDDYVDRLRQEVRLWRKLTAPNQNGIQETETYDGNSFNNLIGNDLLADRLRDPELDGTGSVSPDATLDFGTLDWVNIRLRDFGPSFDGSSPNSYDPFLDSSVGFWQAGGLVPPAQNNVPIPLTMATNDNDNFWNFYGGTNQGLTICTRAGFRRPDHLTAFDEDGLLNEDFETPRGLLPAWCIEGNDTNHNIPTPSSVAGVTGANYIPDVIQQSLDGGYMGELFGFRGCHGRKDVFDDREGAKGGIFYMNFLRFVKDTKVLRDANGLPISAVANAGLRVRAEGWNDRTIDGTDEPINAPPSIQTIDDPMILPTITRHPALKFVRDEIVNLPSDRNGDGIQDDSIDDIGYENTLASRVFPVQPNARDATKRTIALLNATPSAVEPEELIAFDGIKLDSSGGEVFLDPNATLLTIGRDGLGDAEDPRDNLVRVGDLALPFAVGAAYAPANPAAPANQFRADDWVTLSEALSAALGYDSVNFYNRLPGSPGEQRWTLLNLMVDNKGTRLAPATPGPGSLQEMTPRFQRLFVLDNGRLDLNAFAPFVNQIEPVGGPATTMPQFNPIGSPSAGLIANSDYRVGFSEPPAQRLFSMARALNRSGGDPLTTPTIGTVNLNTASEAVLRSVPGFTPSLQFSRAGTEYDVYNPGVPVNPPLSFPTFPFMSETPMGRVTGRTMDPTASQEQNRLATAPVQPPIGLEYQPPLGVSNAFGNYVTNNPGSGFPSTVNFVADGWRGIADVSASLTAYRDRTRPSFRIEASRVNEGAGAPLTPVLAESFIQLEQAYDFSPSLVVANAGFEPNSPIFAPSLLDLAVNNYATDFSRAGLNGQGAASERPGLSGIGSLVGLTGASSDPLSATRVDVINPRMQILPQGGVLPKWDRSVQGSTVQGTVTRHARDRYAMSAVDQDNYGETNTDPLLPGDEINIAFIEDDGDPTGITPRTPDDNFSYTLGRAGFFNENPDKGRRGKVLEDEVLNDVLEELSVFNGAANMVDVRSDFFAAWFIIRGYAREDVQGLDDDEPMRPSYEKRFLMVIDRSNVTDAGQQPRVLFLREVPL